MRKFKLIKEYPGSPKLGSIIKDTNPNNRSQDAWFSDNWGEVGNKEAFFISKSTCPENYPEFWEEIVEKDYEILSGRTHIPSGSTEIYSIRRKSDGVEFKIGDKVYWNWQYSPQKYYTIEGFSINKEDNSLDFYTKGSCKYSWIFNKIQHYKEPILTTEDGYECTLDDRVFGVCIKGSWEICEREVNPAILFLQNKHKEKSAWLYFKTKENRDKYIYENKPEFSRKQIKDRLKNWADRTVIDIILNDLEV